MYTYRTFILLFMVSLHAYALDMEQLAKPISKLKQLASHPELVQTLASIKTPLTIKEMLRIDSVWQSNPDVPLNLLDPTMQQFFKQIIIQPKSVFVELILIGSSGQTVAAVPLTSDYWQGDEPKFTQTLSRQNVYIGEVDWDDSSRTISAQISVPVWFEGDIIGVLTGAVEANLETLSNTEVDEY